MWTRSEAREEEGPARDAINFTVTGDGDSTVVLLHGFSDNLATWSRLTPMLARHHRVVAVDLPGFGGSPRRHGPQFDGYLDAVDEVLDEAGAAGRVSIIGNSLGAITALLYAHRRPDRVERIVLVGMPAVIGVRWYWRTLTDRRITDTLGALSRRLSAWWVRRVMTTTYAVVAFGSRKLPADVGAGYARAFGAPGAMAALLDELHRTVRSVGELRLLELVDSAPVSVLAVWGRYDLPAPARHARRLRRRTGCDVVIIPRCGHLPQLHRPTELYDVIAQFLDEGCTEPEGERS